MNYLLVYTIKDILVMLLIEYINHPFFPNQCLNYWLFYSFAKIVFLNFTLQKFRACIQCILIISTQCPYPGLLCPTTPSQLHVLSFSLKRVVCSRSFNPSLLHLLIFSDTPSPLIFRLLHALSALSIPFLFFCC